MMNQMLIALILLTSLPALANRLPVKADFLKFKYLEIEGTAEADCTHTTANSIDWEVTCRLKEKDLKYTVHLLLNYYPMTNEGFAAYELLYWVNDKSASVPAGDSVSQWTYLDSPKSKIKKMQTRLGIENDASYLQMQLDLR